MPQLALPDRHPVQFPDLDGLRALAALAVVFYHIVDWLPLPVDIWSLRLRDVISFRMAGGPLGVTFFFVLSGFLITYLMLDERTRTGRFQVGRFYMRRLLRIWPLYFVTLAIAMLLCDAFGANGNETGWMYALFLANFDHILHGTSVCGMLGVQWSVCVEEQFYLLWPLVFATLGGNRTFPWAMLAMGIGSLWFTYSAEETAVRYYHLFANMRLLVGGGLLAYGAHRWGADWKRRLTRVPAGVHAAAYLLGLFTLLCTRWLPLGPVRDIAMYAAPLFFFLYVLAHQTHAPVSFLHLRHIPVLSWLGKISYGLYLTHMIAIHIVLNCFTQDPAFGWLAALLALALTVLISHLSYRYFESPFLRLKDRFSPTRQNSPIPTLS